MPTIDLRSAPRDERGIMAGQGEHTGAPHYVQSTGTYRNVPPFQPTIQERIWRACADAPGGWLTRMEIARALGYKKAGWLNAKIEQMVADGTLVRYEGATKSGMLCFWYGVGGE